MPPKPLPIVGPLTAAERAEARAGSDVKARSYEARWWAKGSARVAGVDEAGRGPLAGPVVAAACIIPSNVHIVRTRAVSGACAPLRGCSSANNCRARLACGQVGVADSKQLSEEQREALYEELTTHPQVHAAAACASCASLLQQALTRSLCSQIEWSACIIEHTVIDEINILQARRGAFQQRLASRPELQRLTARQTRQATMRAMEGAVAGLKRGTPDRVLVDGNRVPPALAHNGEAIIGGDDKSFVIGAASIIAKVTRDRIMLALDKRFPAYGFAQHKGYGTKAHMEAIARHGPCDVHRRTFAPIKHMV